MIVGMGVELVDLPRFEAALERFGERMRGRIFTGGERAYAEARARGAESLAVRFAAKVAARRALGRAEIPWKDIEIVREREQAPVLRLHGDARAAARALGAERVWLTLSHSGELCVGQVILEAGP